LEGAPGGAGRGSGGEAGATALHLIVRQSPRTCHHEIAAGHRGICFSGKQQLTAGNFHFPQL